VARADRLTTTVPTSQLPPALPLPPPAHAAQLLGAPAPTVPGLAAEASPLSHVSPAAPPVLLLHGQADRFVPCRQSERLRDALAATGTHVELHTYPGVDHMWLGGPDAATDALTTRTAAFLRRHLISEGDGS
jgi:acetyl esterase/lipase